MKKALFLALIALSCLTARAEDAIPSFLVGVWASDGAVLKGDLLFEGQAVYLGSDGVGAWIAGPPPIGARIDAKFNAITNTIEFDILNLGQRIGHGSMTYDPKSNLIDSGAPKHASFTAALKYSLVKPREPSAYRGSCGFNRSPRPNPGGSVMRVRVAAPGPTPNPSIEGMPKRLRLLCTPHVKR